MTSIGEMISKDGIMLVIIGKDASYFYFYTSFPIGKIKIKRKNDDFYRRNDFERWNSA